MTATTIPTLPPQYNAQATEAKWQKFWEERQIFKANPNAGGKPYCIMIPPPNVTGSLHMGHAFNNSLIDVLVRYHRMKGYNTLYLPGTDHASIAVQTLLEKQLKEEGTDRYAIGREKFLERAWQWKAESGGMIVNQLRRLGVSVDWSRERFTMDEGLSRAVQEAFIRLYEEGLIYRGEYLVNWCPSSQSAVSDLEVENQEIKGNLWHFRYPLADGSGFVEVATTRPETMLGDTAVAVNPNDARYKDLIGKMVKLPIMGREIPIIADELVDPEFGTGCVKVTPAHDPNDFQMGKRHNLPFINIMNKDGTLNENAGPFQGQDRFVARKGVVERLEAEGFLVKVEPYNHTVPYSERAKVPIEPLLSTQWFVKIRPLAERALQALDTENLPNFVPERWRKVYHDWLVKLEDWCISRQLWWGHQIPAWYVVSYTAGEITDSTPFVVAKTEAEAREKAIAKFGKDIKLKRDPDVLDTWFSSGLWPFSTLGWPEETVDLAFYYPTSVLVTGFDIIFFWVARMTMMAAHFTGKIPFQDVYIHGLVLDEKGKKMSKSAGNGIDPLLLIDKYGTDALRYTLIKEVAGAGQNIRLEYDRKKDESPSVEASRNFTNKLWNAARFVIMNLDGKTPAQLGQPVENLEISDRWILSRYSQIVQQTNKYIDNYGLGEAAKGLYDFIWGEFCDWYIELVKSRLSGNNPTSRLVAQQTLAFVLEGILKLLHPFMPHITEEIWHTLNQAGEGESLALQAYPEIITLPKSSEKYPETPKKTATHSWQLKSLLTSLPVPPLLEKVLDFFKSWPNYFDELFAAYKSAIAIFILLVVASFLLRIGLAPVVAVNEIPLLPQTFELIGLGYSIWFIFRYLILAESRKELLETIQEFVNETLLGKEKSENQKIRQETVKISALRTSAAAEAVHLPASAEASYIDETLESDFELLIGTIRTIRNLRVEADVKPAAKIKVILQSESERERQILTNCQSYIKDLAKVEELIITPTLESEPTGTIVGVVGTIQVLVPLAGVVDIETLRGKIEKNLAKVEAEVKSLTERLGNASFINKAPANVVEEVRSSLAEAEKQAEILKARLSKL
ncbi:MAG: valine--tRNA ligase [Oscillatoriaceae bacterium SKW80]|nr:valine--tRNA ligase [Oscillatoriaceae bacterium SKYG93]MCX8120743.1 valine--tRNA ligase [Oscillatoriaceae bacterium SKW80]MDW8453719.1 valine--tRNA ligase [Oscillatoriaceae cyanobacterium SKYGB_i_bin93]HIK26951.1 valine--tRNA ligase [Oscillatoriaceae cyanobacterium M7585_C2015_266]